MSENGHAKLAPSAAHRWWHCPGSVALCATVPSQGSVFAREGTVAHEIAAHCLNTGQHPDELIGAEYYGGEIVVDEDMANHVTGYVEYVRATHALLGGTLYIERKLQMPKLAPDVWGTADCIIAHPAGIVVVDFKYGKGVAVDVRNNPQLLTYALAAVVELEAETGQRFSQIETAIYQPRCPHPDGPVRSHTYADEDMVDFAIRLLAAVERTKAPDALLVPGTEQCQFCDAKAICPELSRQNLAIIEGEFSTPAGLKAPDTLTRAELARVLSLEGALTDWLGAIKTRALYELQAGHDIAGFKLVQKRATRKWRDETDAEFALRSLYGLEAEDLFERKFRSPAQVEKKLPKAQRAELESLIVKESTGLTIAPTDDPRPGVSPALLADFSPVN